MPLTIILTEKLRELSYFSDFKEEQVEVPNKPFLHEFLEGSLDLEMLSLKELSECLETCAYFALDSRLVGAELLWKIGERKEIFQQWFIEGKKTKSWSFDYPLGISMKMDIEGELWTGIKYLSWRKAKISSRWWVFKFRNIMVKNGVNNQLFWRYTWEVGWRPAAERELMNWTFSPQLPSLVRLELIKNYGSSFDEERLIELGMRFVGANFPMAVYGGHLRLVKWVRETRQADSIWKSQLCLCDIAANAGHLECLKYLREQGCKLSCKTQIYAQRGGHIGCIEYLKGQDCPEQVPE